MTRDDEFRSWAQQHRQGLVRTATLLTAGDTHTAQDVVQNALTKLYLAWPRVRAADDRQAYVRRALVNAFTDEMRSRGRRREDLRGELPDGAVSLGATDPDTLLLYDALRELPDRMRATVVLRYFHDLDVRETARALRCTQGTVKSQTARAIDKLRARLGPLLRDGTPAPPDPHRPDPQHRTHPTPALVAAPAPRSVA
ncbi:SigE family RNA polymerase sigma factor [Cellulomonas phragmiteti]|uniref:RNA polymerase sigma24 factor n=1 Tax=Cellulomonas phragmiteti TaxID=478780 RepID=A0ABQ4DQX4_9CELL|nr:SigE family RNA polymerase sigma factor [Cellulomonas phragmiteti]GIG41760.1 RNA polymerase sigma24 factor [Cellulomonas phragmiteti]